MKIKEFSTLTRDLENMKKEFNDYSSICPLPFASPIVFNHFNLRKFDFHLKQPSQDVYDVSFKDKGTNDEKAELLTNSVWVLAIEKLNELIIV